MTWVWIILVIVICQRVIELVIAKRNEAWMLQQGGIERGADHYKWFIVVHLLFFVSIFIESLTIHGHSLNYFLLSVFIFTQIIRVWCIFSLGKFWNTKVIILPGTTLRTTGPYRFLKHPNYIIVGVELFIIPLLLGAYLTAIIFPLLHIYLLVRWRLPIEEKALSDIRSMKKG
ncbi:isoprenylcysteine carboxyl methyltransferase family protein [Virgibacillus sp. DJP39]|uniref:isoprenylcysteine carboxyl methyltransferase family protein n=1 Tax=Virgibacillus sp. DJP39 TaxID=3409790 RepID=UPI003BB70CE0